MRLSQSRVAIFRCRSLGDCHTIERFAGGAARPEHPAHHRNRGREVSRVGGGSKQAAHTCQSPSQCQTSTHRSRTAASRKATTTSKHACKSCRNRLRLLSPLLPRRRHRMPTGGSNVPARRRLQVCETTISGAPVAACALHLPCPYSARPIIRDDSALVVVLVLN
jgi:hypothetical protein